MAFDFRKTHDLGIELAGTAGMYVDRFAQHFNLYRAVSHFVGSQTRDGLQYCERAKFANDVLGDFNIHDQDKDRPEWSRRLQLSRCGDSTAKSLNALLTHAQKHRVHNPALLHQIARTRLQVFGQKDVADSLAYARRASRKLHPDRNASLNNWDEPGIRYFSNTPNGYRYEHARHGAAALFELHNNLKMLLEDDHYQKRLYSRRVLRGGGVTIPQLLSDLTVATAIGVLICLRGHRGKRDSLTYLLTHSAIGYALLLLGLASKAVTRQIAARKQVKCREVVLYRPAPNYTGDEA